MDLWRNNQCWRNPQTSSNFIAATPKLQGLISRVAHVTLISSAAALMESPSPAALTAKAATAYSLNSSVAETERPTPPDRPMRAAIVLLASMAAVLMAGARPLDLDSRDVLTYLKIDKVFYHTRLHTYLTL